MALKSGSIIRMKEFLTVNDYIQSPNGIYCAIMQNDGNFAVNRGPGPGPTYGCLWASMKHLPAGQTGQFYAIMQDDGNFCVYKGTGPGDGHEAWWSPNKYLPAGQTGQFYAIMQDDGNFCVYKGTGPENNNGIWWASGALDPVVDFQDISDIEYDVGAAKTLSTGSRDLYRQQVKNNTSVNQTSTISGSESVSETRGWSDTLGFKVGVSTQFKCGVPLLAEGKVQVSAEVSNTYTWSGSTTQTRTWSFSTPVSVPPHTVIVAFVSAAISTIAVPYTLTGTAIYKAGAKVPKTKIRGIYTGSNSHDLTVTFQHLDPVAMGMVTRTLKLESAKSTVQPAL